ncbi:MAG: sigma-70 family RNA polymerase sigma factor [Planctomycetia bacterium]|nr:sigma-70 family RNA polymerase sigma factor [Planctomycetia bacterium]
MTIANPATELYSEAPGSTSVSLLERVKAHDQEAWRRLVQLYGPLVYQWCRRWELRPDDVADIFQDVFQAVAGQIASFRRERPGDSFRGWLWTITRHKVADHFRRQGKGPVAAGGSDAQQRLLELPEPPADPDPSATDGNLVQRALEQIRGEFEPRTWTMFWRATVEGHATRDIAADLGVTPDAVRVAKSRILKRLRQELADLGEA